ncbi:MAG: hypothetical protein DRI37_06855 [Chloroflexi bacterium]|nr:MAG: hypothetical protein DRI37_06855 [Chloroflexota bacterium]
MISKKGVFLSGAILALIVLGGLFTIFYFVENNIDASGEYKTFSSCQELKSFLKENEQGSYFGNGFIRTQTLAAGMEKSLDTAQNIPESSSTDYSETNIQVEGVDEADIVKTDGNYIYVVSGKKLFILDAYPPENAKIISEIDFDGAPQELFVNGNKLIVFGQDYVQYSPMIREDAVKIAGEISPIPPMPPTHKMFLKVYNLEDKEDPKIVRNMSMDGYYFDSRMIGDYVYVIVNQYIYDYTNPVIPKIYSGDTSKSACNCPEVHYFNIPDSSYKFTTIVAVDTQNDEQEISSEVYLMGGTQNIYVSRDNVYVTYTNRLPMQSYRERMIEEVISPLVSMEARFEMDKIMSSNQTIYDKWRNVQGVLEKYFNGLSAEEKDALEKKAEQRMEEFEKEISKDMEKTIIHKIGISKNEIEYRGRGEVPGVVLNQFSMDENNGYFRIATTTGSWRSENYNHVYILDKNLNIVGKLEDLAKGEMIKSARFIGDRCYLVTFERTDPLFVIGLKDPENPKILGELKISGYSAYLHPYDENHLIGIGKEAEESKWGVRETGVKLALFDVSDVENPEQISKFVIDGNWAYTEVMNDHKAFLFDKDKELLVIPVSVNKVIMDTYITTQGAYVFSVNLDDGFELKGIVEHEKKSGENQKYYYRGNYVRRSLYIDNTLYTVSNSLVKMNDLNDLKEINEVELK